MQYKHKIYDTKGRHVSGKVHIEGTEFEGMDAIPNLDLSRASQFPEF